MFVFSIYRYGRFGEGIPLPKGVAGGCKEKKLRKSAHHRPDPHAAKGVFRDQRQLLGGAAHILKPDDVVLSRVVGIAEIGGLCLDVI